MKDKAEATPAASRRKKRLIIAAKLIVTLLLCGVLIWNADWGGVVDALSDISIPLMLSAFVLMMLSVTISAYKWRVLLDIHGIQYRFNLLHRYYFIAVFFNNFLPTSIGGDGYRIYRTLGNSRSKSSAVIAVFVERLTGILALLLIGYICAILVFIDQREALSRFIVVGGTVSLAVALPLMMIGWRFGWFGRMLNSQRLPKVLKSTLEHVTDYMRNPDKSANMILVSFLFQIHNSIAFYLLLVYGVGAEITIPQLFVVLTLMNLISILPISINGIGVVDGSFIYLVGLYGVPYDAALGVMLVNRVLLVVISIIGAALYFSERSQREVQLNS